jgi:hypothetical protein
MNGYTENIGDFGSRERGMLRDILSQPLPSNFSDDNVKPAFNTSSGYVFLVNADYQCAMINHDTGSLEIFHNTPDQGDEGFLSDLLKSSPDDYNGHDERYIREQAENEGVELPATWMKGVTA